MALSINLFLRMKLISVHHVILAYVIVRQVIPVYDIVCQAIPVQLFNMI